MFDPEELQRAGIQRREDHPNSWRHADCEYRIVSPRRYADHTYKHPESVPRILAAHRAHQ